MAERDPRDARIEELQEQVAARDRRIAELEEQVEQRDARIAELMAKVEALTARAAELEARLAQDSSNSSRPPSSDGPGTKSQPKKPTDRRPGRQFGHKKHERGLWPPEQVRRFVDVVLKECGGCQRPLKGEDSTSRQHQVVEVPPLSAVVTEYRCHALQCGHGGGVTRGDVPAHPRGVFGDRLAALASLLAGKYRLSTRRVKGALSDMLGVELSVGSVSNLEAEMS